MSPNEKINILRDYLKKIDVWSERFDVEIQRIVNLDSINGGNLEYAYVQHFHKEIRGLSTLFQYLLNDEVNKKYVFFPLRAAFEVLLYLEYVLRLNENEILKLLSIDLAQSLVAVSESVHKDEDHPVHPTIKKIEIANKLLGTSFDLTKIKSNTKPFKSIYKLCQESALSLKDSSGGEMYHVYRLYSESNHLRLSNAYSISKKLDVDICWALEYFMEIYIKFYQQILETKAFPGEYIISLNEIKQTLGLE